MKNIWLISLMVLALNVAEGEMTHNVRFSLSGNREVVFALTDNDSSRSFLSMLPLTLDFEDYSNTEKISNVPSPLSTANAPAGYDPVIGDLCVYAPWGNLCIFYRDFSYASGLIQLGHVVSGEQHLQDIEGSVRVEVRVEVMSQ